MSEFKGTKGKWEVTPYQNVYCEINKICAIGDLGEITEEVKANALLISKAPEMLDILKKLDILFEHTDLNNKPTFKDLFEKIKQLIKEATEL
jgi:hypothetical protein